MCLYRLTSVACSNELRASGGRTTKLLLPWCSLRLQIFSKTLFTRVSGCVEFTVGMCPVYASDFRAHHRDGAFIPMDTGMCTVHTDSFTWLYVSVCHLDWGRISKSGGGTQ